MKTFTLAASLVLSFLTLASAQQKNLTASELKVEEQAQASVATLIKNAKPLGMAVLIDSRGFFIAHRLSVSSSSVAGVMPNGRSFTFKLIQQDDPSQMVLLKANDWRSSYGTPVKLVSESPKPGQKVVAFIPSGMARAELTSTNLFGIISENRRLVPLCEIRLEAPVDQIGGAAVFTMDGDLVGIIGAALRQTDKFNTSTQQRAVQDTSQNNAFTNGGRNQTKAAAGAMGGGLGFSQQFGPTSLTVAYVAGQTIMERVVKGFMSPNNEVEHPTIGIYCRDSVRGGALIDNVIPNSPAEKGGIKVGDIIIELAGVPVRNQLDFAKAMISQSVGVKISVRVIRSKELLSLSVSIGK